LYEVIVIGAKSRSGSYGMSGLVATLAASVLMVPKKIV
jgi:hypothetical protein